MDEVLDGTEAQDGSVGVVEDVDADVAYAAADAAVDAEGADPVDQDLRELTEALEAADDLSIDERLSLLRRAEEAIAASLEGLDGL